MITRHLEIRYDALSLVQWDTTLEQQCEFPQRSLKHQSRILLSQRGDLSLHLSHTFNNIIQRRAVKLIQQKH
jgi:hypothetical protein